MEQTHRWAPERDGDLGRLAGEPLPGAEVERHPLPSPVVHGEAHGDERRGGRPGGNLRIVPVAGHLLAGDRTRGVLPEDDVLGGDGADGAQQLHLLGADGVGVEAVGCLHPDEAQQLAEVVLHHVANGSGRVVVAGSPLGADALGDGDLHRLDPVAAPRRLEEEVGEAEGEEILHRLLAQVVVDAVHLGLVEVGMHELVELLRALEVAPERLLDDEPGPAGAGREARVAELADDAGERTRGQGEVQDPVATEAEVAFDGLDAVPEAAEVPGALGGGVVEDAVVAPGGEVGTGIVDRLASRSSEVPVSDLGAGDAEQRQVAADVVLGGDPGERGEKLAAGEVAGRPEDDEQMGLGSRHVTPPA